MSYDHGLLAAIPRVRAHDPLSSVEAAENAAAFAGSHCDRILRALGGQQLTAEEIGRGARLTVVQVDRRMTELQRSDQVEVVQSGGEDLLRDGFRVWVKKICAPPQHMVSVSH